jgi:hypothetical protein
MKLLALMFSCFSIAPAIAQQAPDPALVQKVAGQLERQRNDALNAHAVCSANLVTLQEEIDKLKKQLERDSK